MTNRLDLGHSASERHRPKTDLLAPLYRWLLRLRRVLVWGPSGVGKTTLACHLAARLEVAGEGCAGISADPGLPGFGVPGALALAHWRDGDWRVARVTALCTLDAARYRLPLVQALSRLAAEVPDGILLLDAPGVVRGPAAQELLEAMVEAAAINAVLAILPERGAERALGEQAVDALGLEHMIIAPSPLACKRSKKRRARDRTLVWDAWLEQAIPRDLSLSHLKLSGQLAVEPDDWSGRQVALIDRSHHTLAMGEVAVGDGGRIRARLRRIDGGDMEDAVCLVRDAARGPAGLLGTVPSSRADPPGAAVPPDLASPGGEGADPACFVHLGAASALLVNGLFGDPLLHLRLRQEGRSLLFDLGDGARLAARIAHQVRDVFVSHAHIDHIGGFLWFLRSRIGEGEPCRLFGPPGLADHVCAFIAGVLWDRIGNRGPRFEVLELHGACLRRISLQVGLPRGEDEELPVTGGVLLDEPGFRVRAITLDHGTPVLAFAFEVPQTLRIRKNRLLASGISGGPWIDTLKRRLLAGRETAQLALPNGQRVSASRLARDLVEWRSPCRLVYATDLADSPANRRSLIELASGADALICETGFSQADSAHAARTGHLTAQACGEIAAQAGVTRLVPFHFSRRYQSDPSVLYEEVEAVFSGTIVRSRRANMA